MIPLSHVDGVAVLEKPDRRVGNIERRRASKELDLAFSFESAEGRWAGWAQAITKLLKSRDKTIRIDRSLGSPARGQKGRRRHRGIVKRIDVPSLSELIRLTIAGSKPDT